MGRVPLKLLLMVENGANRYRICKPLSDHIVSIKDYGDLALLTDEKQTNLNLPISGWVYPSPENSVETNDVALDVQKSDEKDPLNHDILDGSDNVRLIGNEADRLLSVGSTHFYLMAYYLVYYTIF